MAQLHKLKSLLPLEVIEQGAQQQIYSALELPQVKVLAIMPDCHCGYDLPIGAVALVENAISASYVGYDIGCGMCAVDTGITWENIVSAEWDKRKKLHDEIKSVIPTGFAKRSKIICKVPAFKSGSGDKNLNDQVNKNVEHQLGTLGGGNHFIEIGKNRAGNLCVVIHSGSRRCGWDVGNYYMRLANSLKIKFFDLDGELGQAYLHDMNYFLDWALKNRLIMIEEVLSVLGFSLPDRKHIITNSLINENHNHAVLTPNGVIHRKGATPADEGQLGVIPGNMRDGTYITRGLGNTEYLSSASHGAGRVLGRKAAKAKLSLEDFEDAMKGHDVYADVSLSTIDESPMAYKDVEQVIGYQDGIVVDVIDHIKPLINIKGGGDDN